MVIPYECGLGLVARVLEENGTDMNSNCDHFRGSCVSQTCCNGGLIAGYRIEFGI